MAHPPAAPVFPKLVEELESKLASVDPGPIAELLRPFEQFFAGLMTRKDFRFAHDFGLKLWNQTVAWKKKNLAVGVYGVEYIPLSSLDTLLTPIDCSEEYLIQMLGNFARLGQLWSEMAKYDRASHAFNQGEQYMTRLQASFPKGDQALFEKRQRNIFCMLVWRAQTHLALQQSEAALRLIFQAKELLADLPAEVEYLSLNVCYNAALQCTQSNRHSEARRLLEVGISVYELSGDRVAESEARLLRLLASVLLQLEEYDKALKCAQLSLEKSPNPAAEVIKYRVALHLNQLADAEATLQQMMNREDVALDLVVYAITLLAESNVEACDRAFQEFELRLLQSALRQKNADRVKLHHFSWLLKVQRLQEAKTLVEQTISQHLDGLHKLSIEIAKEFQAHLWNLAVERFEKREHKDALEWFMHCYRLSEFSEASHKASLLRVISRCYLALGNLSFSLEFAAQAFSVEPRNVLSSYLLFTIFVEQKNAVEASKVLQRFVASEFDPSLLEVLGFEAFERSQFLLACEALELWIQQFRDPTIAVPEHFPRIAHTLVRLLIQETGEERKYTQRISTVLRFTADRLAVMAQTAAFAKVLDDAKWLMSAAWNCGIDACKDGALDVTYQLLTTAADLAALLPAEADQRRLALTVAIAAGVELLGNGNAPEPSALMARVEEARAINGRVDGTDKVAPLLAVLDFKLRERTGESNLLPLLRAVTQTAGATPMLIAMLANEAQMPDISREAFKISLRMTLAQPTPDCTFAAQLLWRLANLCKAKEDIVALLDEFNGFLGSAEMPQDFLENFIVLMYRVGVHFKSIRKAQLAEKVLARALNLLKNLHDRAHLEGALLAAYQSLSRKARHEGVDAIEPHMAIEQ